MLHTIKKEAIKIKIQLSYLKKDISNIGSNSYNIKKDILMSNIILLENITKISFDVLCKE